METYITLKWSFAYGASIQNARRLNDNEKTRCTEEWKNRFFVGMGNRTDLDALTFDDIPRHGAKDADGAFRGCHNWAWIITPDERDALIALNEQRMDEQRDAARTDEIAALKKTIDIAENQSDIPSAEEARRRMKRWNDIYNEGGYGYVPRIVDIDEYNRAKARLAELMITEG